jgi:hypothetical protein
MFYFIYVVLNYEARPIFTRIAKTVAAFSYALNLKIGFPFFWLVNKMEEIVRKRMESHDTRKDYLRILFDSQAETVNTAKDQISDINQVEKKLTIDVY